MTECPACGYDITAAVRPVHNCFWSSHRDQLLSCCGPDLAGWREEPGLPAGVYNAESGRLYTHDSTLVTCYACNKIMQLEESLKKELRRLPGAK